MSAAPREPAYAPYAALRDRCRGLGLPTWRCDTGGEILEEPTEPGLAGLWLRSGEITSLIRAAAAAYAGVAEPAVATLCPGAWTVPIPEDHRRRRAGLTIALALGPEVIRGATFDRACRSAQLDAGAARNTMARMAVFDEASAHHTATVLNWMVRDLAALGEYQGAVEGFTRELTQSYETIDLLYGLGRSMLDLNYPDRFIALACERLHETLPFGWLAARFVPEVLRGSLGAELFVRGTPPGPEGALDGLTSRLLAQVPAGPRSFLAAGAGEYGPLAETQVLAQPVMRDGRLAGILVAGAKHGDDPQVSSYDMQLLEAAAAYVGAFLENAALYADQQAMFIGSLKALTASIDAKDRYTCGHSERVARVAAQLAVAMGMTREQAERVHICGLVHDVGKIGVPEAVLTKPGRLSEEEFALIKLHPEIGHRIIKDIPLLEDVLAGVLHHHERWDGGGYPRGLKGDAIPLFGRLLAVADTFDAMSSTRSYRAAMPREKVLAEIARCAGTQFDPEMARAFAGIDLAEYDRMVARHAREHGVTIPPAAAA